MYKLVCQNCHRDYCELLDTKFYGEPHKTMAGVNNLMMKLAWVCNFCKARFILLRPVVEK